MNCSHSQVPRNKSSFNHHDSSLGRHVNAASRKSLESVSQNQEPIWNENLYEY